jgi:hypothetical protein
MLPRAFEDLPSRQTTLPSSVHEVVPPLLSSQSLTPLVSPLTRGEQTKLTLPYSAFQRLGFAFDILKTPSARRTYNTASHPSPSALPTKTSFLGGEHTFLSAVLTILHEFIEGDFTLVRRFLSSLHTQYPQLVSEEVVITIQESFIRIRELVLNTRTYALLIYIELGRIRRVQKRLMALSYLDVLGRARMTVHLVKVTLAVPMRVDRALKEREEKARRARVAGLHARGAVGGEDGQRKAGILNERVSKVLEFIVGEAGRDDSADEAWSAGLDKNV